MDFKQFNERTAILINKITGNMWFFWASLVFILILRITHPPDINEVLLDLENDLQLLLLAVNAVVGAKQVSLLTRLHRQLAQRDEAEHYKQEDKND